MSKTSWIPAGMVGSLRRFGRAVRDRLVLVIVLVAVLAAGVWLSVKSDGESTRTLGGLLIGATVVALIDVLNDYRIRQREEAEARRRDLDETRRLLYCAIVNHDLGGTVLNALMHHSRTYNFADAHALALKVAKGDFGYGDAVDVVEQINAELGDHPPLESSHFQLPPAPPGPPNR